MKYDNFRDFELYYSQFYSQKKYKETLNILGSASEILPIEVFKANIFTILFDQARIYMMIKEYEKGLEVLEKIINEGMPCPTSWDIFKPLFEDVRYLKLKRKNAILRAKLQEKSEFKYNVYLPKNYNEDKEYPVFFNLHGDGDNIDVHMTYWKPDKLLEKGFIVIYPQASQVLYHNGYGWCKRLFNAERLEECEDKNALYNGRISRGCYDLAHYEMRACYDEITKKYSVDKDNIFIGGMSGGATAALEFTMANLFPIKGFITLCPELQPSSLNKETVEMARNRGVKGVFMEGEHARVIEDEEKMLKIFKEVRLPYESYINKGIGHWYPEDLDEKVDNALKFILSKA